MRLSIERLLSLPKSLRVCLKLFPLKTAIRLPLFIRYNTIIKSLDGNVKVVGGGRIYYGFGNISEFDKNNERSIIKIDGDVTFHAPSSFGHGTRIVVDKKGTLIIGIHFHSTANCTFSSRGKTVIGNNCLFSWNTWISDTDFHQVKNLITGEGSKPNGTVVIGDRVWVCANSTILKGAVIPNGCIVGASSLVNKIFSQENSLLAGNPAVIKKENITLSE